MDEVKSAPLVDCERTEDHVGDAPAMAKQGFCLVGKFVDTSQMVIGI